MVNVSRMKPTPDATPPNISMVFAPKRSVAYPASGPRIPATMRPNMSATEMAATPMPSSCRKGRTYKVKPRLKVPCFNASIIALTTTIHQP